MGYNLKNARNGKTISKFEAPRREFEFLEKLEDL